MTDHPGHWYPFAPEKLATLTSVVLRLLPTGTGTGTGAHPPPLGAILASAGPDAVWLDEEEVPRSGAVVSRTRQHARWHDGSVHTRTGRRRSAGGGEGASGLRFDVLDDRRL